MTIRKPKGLHTFKKGLKTKIKVYVWIKIFITLELHYIWNLSNLAASIMEKKQLILNGPFTLIKTVPTIVNNLFIHINHLIQKHSILFTTYLISICNVFHALKGYITSTPDNSLDTGQNMIYMLLTAYLFSRLVRKRIYAGNLTFRVMTLIVKQMNI
jgi:hypothetical protein